MEPTTRLTLRLPLAMYTIIRRRAAIARWSIQSEIILLLETALAQVASTPTEVAKEFLDSSTAGSPAHDAE